MTIRVKHDWISTWNAEIDRFKSLKPEGLHKDIQALDYHISKLIVLCPKDLDPFLATTALDYLVKLQIYLFHIKLSLISISDALHSISRPLIPLT